MQKFDCLSVEAPLLGAHFLEASAGTGKTFAIEHIVARLLLSGNPPMELEQILAVTFTRAAARELKLRIRSNLEQIFRGAVSWEYLSEASLMKQRIGDALAAFDRCQIFTIHGFCSRMLREFSFEAGFGFTWKESFSSPRILSALQDFFEVKLSKEIMSPEQLGILVQWAGSVEELGRMLRKQEEGQKSKPFIDRVREFERVLRSWPGTLPTREEFYGVRESYKTAVKGNFEAQLEALGSVFSDPAAAFGELIRHKGSLFLFLSPENRKVKAKEVALHPFFDWGRVHLLHLIQEAAEPSEIMQQVLAVWKPIEQRILKEEGSLNPDQLLHAMRDALKQESFRQKVQEKYRAALIDEFQDTDPVQWDIFQTLFLNRIEALYLIGDPKQSIYRFRKADLYTYLQAKESIGAECHFYLDTNFRSSKELIGALNRLFDREWLRLPKEGRALAYLPMRAGLELATDFGDGKGAIHCLLFEGEIADLFPYLGQEIGNLRTQVASLSSFAILVKDRYQAFAVQQFLSSVGIPSIARSQQPLSETLAFEAMEELFEALREPRNLGKAKTVLAGPFGGYTAEDVKKVLESPFSQIRVILDEKGLPAACQAFSQMQLGRATVQENMALQGLSFYSDCHQVLEVLFEWERAMGFSFEGLGRFFESIQRMDPEEAPCQRKESDVEAVQVMTMHVSKGLEFDVVFALGLGARTPECDEEAQAEKLRQLYVAATRAKRRLYMPIPVGLKQARLGTYSPVELFCQTLGVDGRWEEELRRLAEETSLSIERVVPSASVAESPSSLKPTLIAPTFPRPHPQASYLLSFTSLAKEMALEPLAQISPPNGDYTVHNLPRGAETGIAIHAIFERIYREEQAWKSNASIERIVEQELSSNLLAPWKKVVGSMIQDTLDFRLPMGFCLRDLKSGKVLVEAEFLFQEQADYLKGFIDLLFLHEGRLYFVDWKTNWLGEDASHYSPNQLEAAVFSHQYDLQAKIYAQALKRIGMAELFDQAIYFFVRGPTAFCFHPEDLHG